MGIRFDSEISLQRPAVNCEHCRMMKSCAAWTLQLLLRDAATHEVRCVAFPHSAVSLNSSCASALCVRLSSRILGQNDVRYNIFLMSSRG